MSVVYVVWTIWKDEWEVCVLTARQQKIETGRARLYGREAERPSRLRLKRRSLMQFSAAMWLQVAAYFGMESNNTDRKSRIGPGTVTVFLGL
jgi:hypothetical protein